MQELVQSIINGILLGGLYALIGLGMSLVFGIMKLTNLAHGDLIMVSAYISMAVSTAFFGNILIALIITLIVMMVIAFLLQYTLINRVIDKGSSPSLLVTFGLSIIIQNILLVIFGANPRTIKNPLASANIISNEWFSVSSIYFLDFIIAIVVIIGLSIFMKKSFFGMSIRACADDAIASEVMGVNTKKFYAYTFALAAGTAVIAGLLVGMTYTFYPQTGTEYLIIAFGVVVIGGLGSLTGTLLGGIILGLAQLLGSYFFGTAWQLVCGYIVLLILMTIKPEGLLTKATRK